MTGSCNTLLFSRALLATLHAAGRFQFNCVFLVGSKDTLRVVTLDGKRMISVEIKAACQPFEAAISVADAKGLIEDFAEESADEMYFMDVCGAVMFTSGMSVRSVTPLDTRYTREQMDKSAPTGEPSADSVRIDPRYFVEIDRTFRALGCSDVTLSRYGAGSHVTLTAAGDDFSAEFILMSERKEK